MTLKDKINMHLDLYTDELSALMVEAETLHREIISHPVSYWKKNTTEYNLILERINSLKSSQDALEECKNDSITDL